MIDKLPASLVITGSTAIAHKVTPLDTVSILLYRVWESGQHHLSISDIITLLGSVGVTIGIVITLHKIIRVLRAWYKD